MNLAFMDVETGGTDPAVHSLLSYAVVVTDENCNELCRIAQNLEAKNYVVTSTALKINLVDLSTHAGVNIIGAMLELDKLTEFAPLIPVGWNVNFDVQFLTMNFPSITKYLGYRVFDLHSIMMYNYLIGKMEYTKSLAKTAEALGVQDVQDHTALGDTLLSIKVYKKLMVV